MSLISRILKANPSAQVSDMLTGYFVIPSAKSAFALPLQRAVYGGGTNEGNSLSNVMDYVDITTFGNAIDFGDLVASTQGTMAVSSSTRGVFGGGYVSSSNVNTIGYITIATTGNTTSFGALTVARERGGGCGSSTRGLFGGGNIGDYWNNTIDYVTIASTGNATDFGDLTYAMSTMASFSSPTRGVWGGGYDQAIPGYKKQIGYVTIATTGNAINFGDILYNRDNAVGGLSDATRGLFAGGNHNEPASNNNFGNLKIDYITIATTGNAVNFGDLTTGNSLKAAAGFTRGLFFGNRHSADSGNNVIDAVTIQTLGNATDFGNLSTNRYNGSACSSAHGGL